MKAPVATSMRQGDHGPQARSNCKKISPQHAQTGKHEYFLKAESHGRSKPWEFFTHDSGRCALAHGLRLFARDTLLLAAGAGERHDRAAPQARAKRDQSPAIDPT